MLYTLIHPDFVIELPVAVISEIAETSLFLRNNSSIDGIIFTINLINEAFPMSNQKRLHISKAAILNNDHNFTYATIQIIM